MLVSFQVCVCPCVCARGGRVPFCTNPKKSSSLRQLLLMKGSQILFQATSLSFFSLYIYPTLVLVLHLWLFSLSRSLLLHLLQLLLSENSPDSSEEAHLRVTKVLSFFMVRGRGRVSFEAL